MHDVWCPGSKMRKQMARQYHNRTLASHAVHPHTRSHVFSRSAECCILVQQVAAPHQAFRRRGVRTGGRERGRHNEAGGKMRLSRRDRKRGGELWKRACCQSCCQMSKHNQSHLLVLLLRLTCQVLVVGCRSVSPMGMWGWPGPHSG